MYMRCPERHNMLTYVCLQKQSSGGVATILKKRLWHSCFPVNFEKFLRTPFFTEHLWWLLICLLTAVNHSRKNTIGMTINTIGILRKRCTENMRQIYGRTPMTKCDFNKVAFTKNTYGGCFCLYN